MVWIWRAELRLIFAYRRVCADETENPFTAVTEKMTQTFTMAFTAKCAECSVCELSTACNLSRLFFIFFIKSQLLLAFYIVAVLVSPRRVDEHTALIQPFTKERKSSSTLVIICCMYELCAPLLHSVLVVWVLTEAIWVSAAVRCPLAGSWQTRRECMPIVDGGSLNWWPRATSLPFWFVLGSLQCHCVGVFSKLKQAQVYTPGL